MPHVPPELLDDFAGLRPVGEAGSRLREHLLEICPGCRQADDAPAFDEAAYLPAFERLQRAAPELGARAFRERTLARGRVAELRDLAPHQRLLRVRNGAAAFRGRAFELELLAEARAALPHDPASALAWAQLAETVVILSEVTLPTETACLATAFQAAAHQALGRDDLVPPLLGRIEAFLAHSPGFLAPDAQAELLLVTGALFTDRGLPELALDLLEEAVILWQGLQQADPWLRSLLELARALLAAGEVEAAYDAWHLAAVVHQAGRDPELGDLVRSLGDELRARGALPAPPSPEWPEPPGRQRPFGRGDEA